jgi:hypothetical protein
VTTAYQLLAATVSIKSMSSALETPPVSTPAAFAGYTAAGYPLGDPLDELAAALKAAQAKTDQFIDEYVARETARIERFVVSQVQDAGREAASVAIVADKVHQNYVRVLNPPSCSRCAVLAGRIYRDLEGFQRHPLCDCVHWPVQDWSQAQREGLVSSPQEAFDKGQITGLSKSDARAIEAGSDISQVVNAAQGMTTTNLFGRNVKATTYGTTKRSAWRKAHPNQPVRLRPEAIYQLAGQDREEVLRLLRVYGYLTS